MLTRLQLGNNRGNKYSKKSIHRSPTSTAFWNFSIDEFAFHDIPDSIAYVLDTTGQASLSYIGFSQGTAQAFASLSIHPKLNDQISVFIALAPAMSPPGLSNSVVNALVKASPEVIYLAFGRGSILQSATMWQALLYPPLFVRIIDWSLVFLFNWNGRNISATQKLAAYPHLYSFTSTKSVVHWFQIIRNKTFQMFDDETYSLMGFTNGSKYYKVARFPTRNIKTLVKLVYGGSDSLVDIDVLKRQLPEGTSTVEVRHYEHLDFLWGEDVEECVFPHVFDALEGATSHHQSPDQEGLDENEDGQDGVLDKVSEDTSSPLAAVAAASEATPSTLEAAYPAPSAAAETASGEAAPCFIAVASDEADLLPAAITTITSEESTLLLAAAASDEAELLPTVGETSSEEASLSVAANSTSGEASSASRAFDEAILFHPPAACEEGSVSVADIDSASGEVSLPVVAAVEETHLFSAAGTCEEASVPVTVAETISDETASSVAVDYEETSFPAVAAVEETRLFPEAGTYEDNLAPGVASGDATPSAADKAHLLPAITTTDGLKLIVNFAAALERQSPVASSPDDNIVTTSPEAGSSPASSCPSLLQIDKETFCRAVKAAIVVSNRRVLTPVSPSLIRQQQQAHSASAGPSSSFGSPPPTSPSAFSSSAAGATTDATIVVLPGPLPPTTISSPAMSSLGQRSSAKDKEAEIDAHRRPMPVTKEKGTKSQLRLVGCPITTATKNSSNHSVVTSAAPREPYWKQIKKARSKARSEARAKAASKFPVVLTDSKKK